MISIKNIKKVYISDNNIKCVALNDISLNLPESGFVAILGKSGSGKTTLLNILAGLINYDSGEYLFKGMNINNLSEKQMDIYRNRHVGIIFQNYNLIDDFNVYNNISLPLKINLTNKNNIDTLVTSALDYVELSHYKNRKIYELSGGEQQRIAISRALIKNPSIILADEPTGNLDSETASVIMKLLKKLSKDSLVLAVK